MKAVVSRSHCPLFFLALPTIVMILPKLVEFNDGSMLFELILIFFKWFVDDSPNFRRLILHLIF